MNKLVAGFYHDPPIWLGDSPIQNGEVNFSEFNKTIFVHKFDNGIQMKATREGVFAFSFKDWPPDTTARESATGEPPEFDKIAELSVNRALVMNAFLASFYTALLEVNSFSLEGMAVTPSLMIHFSGEIDRELDGMSFGNQRVSHLACSRFSSTYQQGKLAEFDTRLMQRIPLGSAEETLRKSAQHLEQVLSFSDGPLLADLFLRANNSYQEHNYSASLITNWAIIERLVSELWHSYIEKNRQRDGKSFINNERKVRLENGSTFSAAIVSEILSIVGEIDLDLYEKVTKLRRARNNWIHALEPISRPDALLCIEVCERLLESTRSLRLQGTKHSQIHW